MLAAPLCLGLCGARADMGGTVSLQSDARFRGETFSKERPQAQLSLAWDGREGWYGGAQLSRVKFVMDHSAWYEGYAGRIVSLTPTLDAEAGVMLHAFPAVSDYNFHEVYVGLLAERWSLRLHSSPNYFGAGERSLYASLQARWPLAAHWRIVTTLGALWGQPGRYTGRQDRLRLDGRVGLAWQQDAWSAQLAAVTVGRGGPYTWTDTAHRSALVFSVSASY